jgi:ubiquinone/menaquinone biosynthesis C-methylase UbiE
MLPLDRQNAYRERYRRRHPGWRPSGEAFEALTRQHLGPHQRVLDLGCGRGGVMELFWREVRRAVGLDPDLASLREHRAGFPRVCGLGDRLPFAPASFDVVIALWVFEHLAQPERVLAEAYRVLAPGGHVLCLTPNAHHPLILANRFSWAFPVVQRLLVPRLYGRAEADTFRVRYRANTLGQLRRLARESGFRVTRLEAISDPTYLAFNPLLFELSVWFERLLPAGLGVHLLGDFERG